MQGARFLPAVATVAVRGTGTQRAAGEDHSFHVTHMEWVQSEHSTLSWAHTWKRQAGSDRKGLKIPLLFGGGWDSRTRNYWLSLGFLVLRTLIFSHLEHFPLSVSYEFPGF